MNKYELAVSRFANDISIGALVPGNEEPFDGVDFTLNDKQFASVSTKTASIWALNFLSGSFR